MKDDSSLTLCRSAIVWYKERMGVGFEMDHFVHSKQNYLHVLVQCDVKCVRSHDRIDQASLLLTSPFMGGEARD